MSNQTTPLAVDGYSRHMVSMFDERDVIGVPTAGQAFFGDPASGSVTLYSPDKDLVDIDIVRGNERLAATIQRGSRGRTLNLKDTKAEKYSSFSRKFPLIEEVGDINATQLLLRSPGETPYEIRTRLDRMRDLAMTHHIEHIRRTVRACEFLAWQSVLTGKMPSIIGTVNADLIYDFRRNATHISAVGTAWNGVSPDIYGDIDGACDKIRANGHVNPDMCVMGGLAMGDFVADATIAGIADNRRIEWIQVGLNNPAPSKFNRYIAGGLTARGVLRTPKGYELWIFTYTDVYTASNGTATKYMPDDQVLITASMARCDRYFGPNEMLPLTAGRRAWYQEMFGFSPDLPPMPPMIKGNVVDPTMFYCDGFEGSDHKNVAIRTQAAPIFATTMTDAFVTLTSVHT